MQMLFVVLGDYRIFIFYISNSKIMLFYFLHKPKTFKVTVSLTVDKVSLRRTFR